MHAEATPPLTPPVSAPIERAHPSEGVIFVARFGIEERRSFEHACRRAGHRATVISTPSVCRELLDSEGMSPRSVFVDPELPGARELVAWIRGNPRWYGISVVALVSHPTEGAYVRAHAVGADDVTLRSDVGAVTRRLAAMRPGSSRLSTPTQGCAWVGHPSEERRCIVGRVLRQAGFEVAFASNRDELLAGVTANPEVAILIVAESLLAGNTALIAEFRDTVGQPELPTVILDAESDTEHAGGTLGYLGMVADSSAPDNLLFVVNELRARLDGELRSSQRLLYSTLCAYRRPQQVSPEFGLTYNISRDGLYIRTVDAPKSGSCVWLELRPPGTTTIVHLRGRVVWVQPSISGTRATTPPGFGVRILDRECPPADLASYQTAYQTFREEPRPYVVPSHAAEGPVRASQPPNALPRLLLVDDDERTLKVYRRVLDTTYDITTASNGAEAIQRFTHGRFDAVMTDIGMPDMNGLEVLRRIHEVKPATPVIIATGAPSIDTAIHAVEHGAFRYLTKPFDAATLKSTVERAVQMGRLSQLKQDALRLHEDALGKGTGTDAREAFTRAIDQLFLVYQPIVSWSSRSVYGYETLVRSGEPALPHPGALFQAAEQLGELRTLGRAIRGLTAGPIAQQVDRLFFNLHPQDLMDDDLFDVASPLSAIAHRVTLEITERSSLDGVSNAASRLADLRAMGFTIAIDDIGAGFAGLTAFAQLEPDVAKLDMTLIRDVHRVPTKQRLIRSFQEVCDDLGILLICEGVETIEERDCLVELGCDLFQGYLFARPQRTLDGAQF